MNALKAFSLIVLASISMALIGCTGLATAGSPTSLPTPTPVATTAPVEATLTPTLTTLPGAKLPPGVTVASVTPYLPPSQAAGSGETVPGTAVPLPPPAVPQTPQGVPPSALTVTMADNGKTITLRVGQEFLLNLSVNAMNTVNQMMWTISIDHPEVVSRVMNLMPINGAQGIFRANQPGQANLSATGRFVCPTAAPCVVPNLAMGFRVQILVQ